MGLFKSKAVGLELDAYEARAIELQGTPASPRLSAWGRISLPQRAIKDGMIIDPEQVGAALKTLWEKNNFKSRKVILGISNQGVLVRFAVFPKVPRDKLDNMIRFQAQDYLPMSINNVVLDYMVMGEKQTDEGQVYEVLLVAAQRSMLDAFLAALKAANLEPQDIDVSSLALMRMTPKDDLGKAIALVNVTSESGNIVVVEKVPRLARMIPVNLKNTADMVASAQEGQPVALPSRFPKELFSAWSQSLASEIHSSIAYYQSQDAANMVEKIYLSGWINRIDSITDLMQENFDIPVLMLNPAERFAVSTAVKDKLASELPEYTVSISLGLRGLEG